jgi:hypothetical protein
VAEGCYFGLACAEGEVFAFRHGREGDLSAAGSGRIVRFEWRSGTLVERGAVAEGLHPHAHQLEHHDGRFYLVDTAAQTVIEFDAGWTLAAAHPILPPADPEGPDHGHVNSVVVSATRVHVMLHNRKRGLPSEIVEYDRAFRELSRIALPCSGCHDIVPLPDGSLLTCLSPRGEIASIPGEAHGIDDYWTRGLVVGGDEVAVGSSLYGRRMGRALLPGFVTFLDRDFRRTGRLYLPAAPTQMRGLDVDPA